MQAGWLRIRRDGRVCCLSSQFCLSLLPFDNRNTLPSEGASHGWNEDVV